MIDKKISLCGVIGYPLTSTLSPFIHNKIYEKNKLKYKMLPFETKHLKETIAAMKTLNIAMYAVTSPHKQKIIKYLDKIDKNAKKINAINTVINKKGKLIGYNTDYYAAIETIKAHTNPKNKKIVILGAGGAARAIAYALKDYTTDITIANRTTKKAKKIAKELKCDYCNIKKIKNQKIDLLINATCAGMWPQHKECPINKNIIKKSKMVFDIVYNPIETKLIKKAKKCNCETIIGLEMFARQAIKQIELLTTKKTSYDYVLNKLKKVIK